MKHPYKLDVKNWLSSIYTKKLKSCPSNPAYDCIFNCKYKQQYEQKEKTIKPFGLLIEPILQESTMSVSNVHKSILPYWIFKKTQAIPQLNKLPQTKTHPSTHLENFHTILLHHPNHQYIFTDGSKDNNKTACAAVHNKNHSQESPSSEKLHLHCRSMYHWPCRQHHF